MRKELLNIKKQLDEFHNENILFKNDFNLNITRNEVINLTNALRSCLIPSLYHSEYSFEDTYYLTYRLFKKVFEYNNQNTQIEAITEEFYTKLPFIAKMLKEDTDAFLNGDPAANSKEEIILSYPGFYAILIYRLAHEMYVLNIPYLPRMLSELAHSATGIDINPGASIGKSFFIDHGTGVVIGETCIIGDNVKIYQGVTLGALSTKDGQALNGVKRHPNVLNNVTIYANATILGGDVTIGNNVTIGGNSFITQSIKDNTIVKNKICGLEFISKKGF